MYDDEFDDEFDDEEIKKPNLENTYIDFEPLSDKKKELLYARIEQCKYNENMAQKLIGPMKYLIRWEKQNARSIYVFQCAYEVIKKYPDLKNQIDMYEKKYNES